ncbi:MAG: hypothetical protein DMF03_08440 [Verrucomicrobia bacterium]|nr:MAG: hypothetical protein DMF03_08440 [Verrucomicrobiota bacterium]
MPARKKLLLALSFVLLALSLASLLVPPIMERSIPIWLRFEAARSGLAISFSDIHAPFLRPLEIRNLQITTAGVGGVHFEFTAPRVEAGLGFAAIFGTKDKSHPLRSIRVKHARIFLRSRAARSTQGIQWATLAALLPARFEISADEIRLEQPMVQVELRDATIFAAATRSGVVSASSIAIHAPLLQKIFADVHGVARWEDNHLTLGSLRLIDGLTIDSLMFDLSRLGAARLGTELSVSAFGGHMRANVTTERYEKARIWELAGTASGISLPRLATALGATETVRGSVRASKFTFRGDPRDVLHATASIWTELIDFSWRERKADAIMLGANFYGRTIQLQQLYIKQRRNELTLSGETVVGSDWLNPDFRGDIIASVNDLGQFAELFGGSGDAFGGTLSVRGRVHTRERSIDGELAITGDGLKIFYAPVHSLTARVGLDSKRVRLDQFELKRDDDFLRAQGSVDFAHNRAIELSAEFSCRELGDYPLQAPLVGKLAGPLKGKVESSGDASQSRTTLYAEANPFSISAQGSWHDQSFTIDQLDIDEGDLRAGFTGEVVLTEPRKLRITVSPTTELRTDLAEDSASCLHGILLTRSDAGKPFSKIRIEGNKFLLDAMGPLSVCDENEDGQPLRINIPAPAEPSPTPSPTP